MDLLYDVIVVLHLIGMAMIVGGWLMQIRSPAPKVAVGMLHGALLQVVTGLILTGMASADVVDTELNNTKIAVKLVTAMVVAGLAVVGNARPDAAKPALVHALGGLAVVNVVIAVLW